MRPEEIEELANKIVGAFTRPKTVEAGCASGYVCAGYECLIEFACDTPYVF